MPTMRLCPWITEIILCKLFLVIRMILHVVQYQNISRNLPLMGRGVQEWWEELCVTGRVIDGCWRRVGVLCDISDYFQKQHPPPSVWFYLSWFPPKTPPEFCCNKVLLFCLYRPVAVYIWFVAGCMFKLYHCCSLYSVLVFLCVSAGWNGTSPVCFSEEIFRKLHKSCLAVLKTEPWTVCTTRWILPRAGGTLPAALRGLPHSLCSWGSPGRGWAVGEINLCSHCEGNGWLSVWNNLFQLDPPSLPSAQGSHRAELLLIYLLQNSFLKTRKASTWACSGYTECIIISDPSNWDLSFFSSAFIRLIGLKCFTFLKASSLKCQCKRKEKFYPVNLSPFIEILT